jgi:hypothetical protein
MVCIDHWYNPNHFAIAKSSSSASTASSIYQDSAALLMIMIIRRQISLMNKLQEKGKQKEWLKKY